MDRIRRERREADRDVLGALRRGVADPFAAADQDRLAGAHLELTGLALHAQRAVEHHRVLVEVPTLSGLGPAGRRSHARDARALLAVARPARELLDGLGRLTSGFHADGGLDQ